MEELKDVVQLESDSKKFIVRHDNGKCDSLLVLK
jgi:hypothetical protein